MENNSLKLNFALLKIIAIADVVWKLGLNI